MLLISIVAAYGQSAQIQGAISDSSKTGVDGASIVASNTETGFKRSAKSDGEVSVILMLDQGTEVEVKLPGRFEVSPQIAGAIKAVPGVVAVEAV